MEACEHGNVVVDYDHPAGTLSGVRVSELMRSDPETTRPVMVLRDPRCEDCGAALSSKALGRRWGPGGDCYDERFRWA